MTDEQRWAEIEACLDDIVLDVGHRCYADRSITGAMYIALLVKGHLKRVDELLTGLHSGGSDALDTERAGDGDGGIIERPLRYE